MGEPEPTPDGRRGRPKSVETQALDAKVYAIIEQTGTTGITRPDVITKLVETERAENPEAVERKPSLVYLSFYRLRRDEKVYRQNIDGKHFWYAGVKPAEVPAEPAA